MVEDQTQPKIVGWSTGQPCTEHAHGETGVAANYTVNRSEEQLRNRS